MGSDSAKSAKLCEKASFIFSYFEKNSIRLTMASLINDEPNETGFQFDNVKRNAFLAKQANMAFPKATKTGTTICGAVFKGGVIVGADTRATGGDIVANKNCQKIHPLAPNMVCCGAGTAADCDKVTEMISSQLELLRLNSDRQQRVKTANRLFQQMLFRYQGHIGAYLILAGVDFEGSHLYTIHAHGSSSKVPYSAMGSGSLAAISILEEGWHADMEEEAAKKLVRDAIVAGIINDMGSGSTVDIAVLKPNDVIDYLRPYEKIVSKGERKGSYKFAKGTTAVLSTKVVEIEDVEVRSIPMET